MKNTLCYCPPKPYLWSRRNSPAQSGSSWGSQWDLGPPDPGAWWHGARHSPHRSAHCEWHHHQSPAQCLGDRDIKSYNGSDMWSLAELVEGEFWSLLTVWEDIWGPRDSSRDWSICSVCGRPGFNPWHYMALWASLGATPMNTATQLASLPSQNTVNGIGNTPGVRKDYKRVRKGFCCVNLVLDSQRCSKATPDTFLGFAPSGFGEVL